MAAVSAGDLEDLPASVEAARSPGWTERQPLLMVSLRRVC